jgi:hypothetical protein
MKSPLVLPPLQPVLGGTPSWSTCLLMADHACKLVLLLLLLLPLLLPLAPPAAAAASHSRAHLCHQAVPVLLLILLRRLEVGVPGGNRRGEGGVLRGLCAHTHPPTHKYKPDCVHQSSKLRHGGTALLPLAAEVLQPATLVGCVLGEEGCDVERGAVCVPQCAAGRA